MSSRAYKLAMTAGAGAAWILAGHIGLLAVIAYCWLTIVSSTNSAKAKNTEQRVNNLVPSVTLAKTTANTANTRVGNLSSANTTTNGLANGNTTGTSSSSGLTDGTINGNSGGASAGTAHTHTSGSYAVANGTHTHSNGSFAVTDGTHHHVLPTV